MELREGNEGRVEDDKFLGYPIKLERWLMEGSYDLVWKAMASREVPSEEYGIFSEVRFIPFGVLGSCGCGNELVANSILDPNLPDQK